MSDQQAFTMTDLPWRVRRTADLLPKLTIAVTDYGTVHCFGRLRCRVCGRYLDAVDIEMLPPPRGVIVVCQGCHQDLLMIGG